MIIFHNPDLREIYLGRRDSSRRKRKPPPAHSARRSCLGERSGGLCWFWWEIYISYVVDDHNDGESDDDVHEYDESDDDADLTRSKSSGKEVVIGRVPADGSDLQFLVLRD